MSTRASASIWWDVAQCLNSYLKSVGRSLHSVDRPTPLHKQQHKQATVAQRVLNSRPIRVRSLLSSNFLLLREFFHTFGWSSCCVRMTKCRRVPGFFHVAFQDPIDQHQSSVISFQNETTARKQRKRNEGMPRLFLSNSGKLILLLAWFDWIIVFQIESLLNSVGFGECNLNFLCSVRLSSD